MRVALVCPDDLSVLLYCTSLIKALRRDRANVIFTVSPITEYQKEIQALDASHVTVEMSRYIDPLKDLRYFLTLYRFFRRERIEVVVNWTTKPNLFGPPAARLAGARKIIYAVRGRGAAFLANTGLKARMVKALVSALYWLASRTADKVWFTNAGDLEYFVSRGLAPAGKTILTKNSVNLDDYSLAAINPLRVQQLRQDLGLQDGQQVVIMVARMLWSKGVRELVEAAEALKEKLPGLVFLLVGPREEGSPDLIPEEFLREAEKRVPLRWLGFRKDVKELYALSDLAVLPSYYKEGGYPRALLEPMTLGKPVIAANLPDCRGPVEDGRNGYLVPPRDSQALARAIFRIMGDEELRRRFGQYSRRKIEREFDDQLVVARLIEELRQTDN
jgi:N,N'-diacetylbacillosaminyl-diphospho-undecaprenol alpha-1,3-N-acetylgalactosaminyltransferase